MRLKYYLKSSSWKWKMSFIFILKTKGIFVVVQSVNFVWLFAIPWTTAHQAPLSSTISLNLLKLMSTESVMFCNHLIICYPFSFCFQTPPASGSFQWVGSLCQVAKVLELKLQHVLPINIQGWFPLGLTSSIALLSKGLSRAFSNTTVLKYQFFGAQPSLWSNSHIRTWLLEKP